MKKPDSFLQFDYDFVPGGSYFAFPEGAQIPLNMWLDHVVPSSNLPLLPEDKTGKLWVGINFKLHTDLMRMLGQERIKARTGLDWHHQLGVNANKQPVIFTAGHKNLKLAEQATTRILPMIPVRYDLSKVAVRADNRYTYLGSNEIYVIFYSSKHYDISGLNVKRSGEKDPICGLKYVVIPA